MTEQGSPAGVSTRRLRRVWYDPTEHPSNMLGITWEVPEDYDSTSHLQWVNELEPEPTTTQGRRLTAEELERLPSFFAEAPATGKPTTSETASATTSRTVQSKAKPTTGRDQSNPPPRKLLYAEVLAAGRHDLTDAEYRLLMAMWKYADNTTLGDIYPGHARLAEQVGLAPTKNNRDSIGRRISSLIQKGYVVRVREGATVPRRRAAEYRLTLPEWEEGTESTAVSGTR